MRAAAAGLAAEGIGPGDAVGLLGPNGSDWAVAYHAVISLGAIASSLNPLLTPEEIATQLRSARRQGRDRRRAAARGGRRTRGCRCTRSSRSRPAAATATAGAARRPGRRPRRAAVLERHDRRLEGRDADAPQPRREHGADPLGAPDRRGRRADRRAAVLPHLRPDRRAQPRALAGRDDRHDGALRHGGVPRPARAPPRHARAHRAAGRARAGEGAGRRGPRPRAARRDLGRRAARRRDGRAGGRAARRADPPGLRDDGGEPGHAHRGRRGARGRRTRARSGRCCRAPRGGSSTPTAARTPTATASSGSAARR